MMAPVTTLGERQARGTPSARDVPSRGVAVRGLAVLALVVPVCLAIVLRRDAWGLSSDSVAQQSIVQTWFHVGHARTYLPPDTWLLKLPVYVVVEALPLAAAHRVLLESAALAAVTALLTG